MSSYKGRRPGFRRIPPDKLRAASVLYRSGMSPREIAQQIWWRYGYPTPTACEQSLGSAFRNMGLRRSIAEAKCAHHSRRRCRCGCSMDERTPGCQTCNSRHYIRKTRGTGIAAPALLEPKCIGCGADWSEKTYACRNCIDRHSHRRQRHGPAAPLRLKEAA